MNPIETRVRLDTFNPIDGLDRGRSKFIELIWYLFKMLFFLSSFPWPQKLKHLILRSFGAKVGKGVNIKPRVNIHFPWKLELGDYCWIGEEVFLLNFEKQSIGKHACISQRSFLCGGNHDFRREDFRYRNGPISIGDGAWIGANGFVAPGVTVGIDAVTVAGAVITQDLPQGMICGGSPCIPIKERWQ